MFSTLLPRRLWPLAVGVVVLNVAGCGFTLAPPGFVHESRHGINRARFDYNTFRRFSLSFERYDRLPPASARVKLFRWSHLGSVDKSPLVPFGESVILTEGTIEPANPGVLLPQSPNMEHSTEASGDGTQDYVPPLAPPSEIDEPRFPPFEMEPPELDENPLDGLVTLSFSEVEEEGAKLPAPFPQNPAECNVPLLDTWNPQPE